MFQEYALFPHLTALGNVMTALGHRRRASGGRGPNSCSRWCICPSIRIAVRTSFPAASASASRWRGHSRAKPAVLLLDEPFAAVDRAVRRRLQDEIDALRRTLDIPLILVTHDFDDVVRLATHLLILERGRAVACGSLLEI